MGKSKFTIIFGFLSILMYIPLCVAADKPVVFVSIVPQKYFVQQIGKDLVDVEVMVQPGASPATYEPKPSQMARLSSCAAYFAIGVPFENAWLDRIRAVNPNMQVFRTDKDVDKIPMVRHHHEEEYQDVGHSGHIILDPHIWLSPVLVKKQAAVILEGLAAIVPGHAAELKGNYRSFLKSIDALDAELKAMLSDAKGRRFMVFHPSWGYFAKEYGLEQVPIEIEGKTPKPFELEELIRHARENNIHIIFVQPQFSQKSAKVVAREIKGKVISVDPLAEDWSANLREVAEKFKSAAK